MTDGFYRLKQIIPDILPISRSSFLRKVKDGEYPQPVRLGKRTVAWRKSEIQAYVEKVGKV